MKTKPSAPIPSFPNPTPHTYLYPRHNRMTRRKPPIRSPSLPIHITRVVARQKADYGRHLVGNAVAAQGVELPDFADGAAGTGGVEGWGGLELKRGREWGGGD